MFPGPWIEPLVLIALGTTLLFVSGRAPAPARSVSPAQPAAPDAEASRSIAR